MNRFATLLLGGFALGASSLVGDPWARAGAQPVRTGFTHQATLSQARVENGRRRGISRWLHIGKGSLLMARLSILVAVFGSWCLVFAGCASVSRSSTAPSAELPKTEEIDLALVEGRTSDVREMIAPTLRAQPENGYLHLLTGLSYYLEQPSAQSQSLAKVGFDAAAKFAPGYYWAHYLNGMSALELHDYPGAAEAFCQAILIDPNRAAAYHGLAIAAFNGGDFDVAAAAANYALSLAPTEPTGWRTAVLASAARGDRRSVESIATSSKASTAIWREIEPALPEANRLLDSATRFAAPQDTPTTLPQASPAETAAATQASTVTTQPSTVTTEPSAVATQPLVVATQPSMSETPTQTPATPTLSPVTPTLTPVTPTLTPATPTALPAVSGSPSQVMVEVTLLLNQAEITQSTGINLLDGLTVQFGLDYGRTVTDVTATPETVSSVFTTAIRIPQITYSLNLFNTRTDYYRVLARPSLVASLGLQSQFFIGRTILVGVSGINLGSLAPIDVGITVKITPTEITQDHATFNVEIVRSFLTQETSGTFTESLTTFKQSVNATAKVEFGTTMILSGLYEDVDVGTSSKTPGLGDIPGLDILFNARDKTARRDVALMLITPRLSGAIATSSRDFRGEVLDDVLRLWEELVEPTSSMAEILKTIRERRAYRNRAAVELLYMPDMRKSQAFREIVDDTTTRAARR